MVSDELVLQASPPLSCSTTGGRVQFWFNFLIKQNKIVWVNKEDGIQDSEQRQELTEKRAHNLQS